MIEWCFKFSRRQVDLNHPHFLHTHPKMERDLKLDPKHVIVDIEDLEILKNKISNEIFDTN